MFAIRSQSMLSSTMNFLLHKYVYSQCHELVYRTRTFTKIIQSLYSKKIIIKSMYLKYTEYYD